MAAIDCLSPTQTASRSSDRPIFQFPEETGQQQLHVETARPAQQVIFTSTELPREPRAWERKPAQPFAPRHDAQKVWKRQPLKNITSEDNAKRSRDDGDGVTRPTKRLKIYQATADEKENEDVEMALGYSPMKLGSAPLGTSVDAENVKATEHDVLPRRGMDPDHVAEAVTAQNSGTDVDNSSAEDATAGISDVNTPGENTTSRSAQTSESAVNDSVDQPSIAVPAAHAVPEMCFDITSANIQHDRHSTSKESPHKKDRQSSIADQLITVPPQPEFLSPKVTSSFSLPVTTSPSRANSSAFFSVAASASAPQPNPPIEQDDTAFLTEFLQRTKQAREKNQASSLNRPIGERIKTHLVENHNAAAEFNKRKRTHSPEPEDLSEIDDDEPTATTTTFTPLQEDPTEKPPLSPSRRSNRLTASRLPRPQRPTVLTANISLRRLNGTEFISMAKKRTAAQNAALLLRNNTKTNKGASVYVPERLEQMKATKSEDKSDNSSDGSKSGSDPKKSRRGIVWAEKIARFRDDDGEEYDVLSEDETNKLSSKEWLAKFVDSESEEEEPAKDNNAESADPDYSPNKKSKSTTSEKTVKRKRKDTDRTTNGTPLPKRSSVDLLLEEAREQVGVDTSAIPGSGGAEDARTERAMKRPRTRRATTLRGS